MRQLGRTFALVLIAALVAVSARALGIPPQGLIRHAVMSSQIIVVGEMVSAHPFDRTVSGRSGSLLVTQSVYGLVVAGDSVTVHWGADRWYPSNGNICAMADGDLDLDTVMHRPALWCLGPRGELRSLCLPTFVDHTPLPLLTTFVEMLERPSSSAVNVMKDDPQLELKHDSVLKRGVVAKYLRREIERRQRAQK
jgi:hypothetical protein